MVLRVMLAVVLATMVLVAGLKLVTQLDNVYTTDVKGVISYGEKLLDNITSNKAMSTNATLEKNMENIKTRYKKTVEQILDNITKLYNNINMILKQLNSTSTSNTYINTTTIKMLEEKLSQLEKELEQYRKILNEYASERR